MNYREFTKHFKFLNHQRAGILILFVIITVMQTLYFFADFSSLEKQDPQKEQWMSLQSEIDSLKWSKANEKPKFYTFNPNFISDYKGYKLGMSVPEINRLLAFRKENKYVNSAKEFQEVTKVSDSLLSTISIFFKFPDWVQNKPDYKTEKKEYAGFNQKPFAAKEKVIVLDINQATQEDLIKLYGIGEALSLRILKQKEILGCFVSMEQMKDIWGLSPEVLTELNAHFKAQIPSTLKKIKINDASLKELSAFPYFKYALAKQIVTYRSMNGDFNNIEDLAKIKDFPVEKAKIISLYLEF